MSGEVPIGDPERNANPTGDNYVDQQNAIVQQVIDDQAKYDEQFRTHHAELLKQSTDMRAGMMNKIKGTPPIAPEVQQIVDILVAQPLLVPCVQKLLEQKVKDISEAVQKVLNE